MPLLGFLDDNQPRCYARTEKGWSWRRCNPLHRVSASVPLPDGRHLTVELGDVAAVQIYPIEMLASQDRKYQARRAGSTVVRWESPESAAKQFSKTSPPRSAGYAFRARPAMADGKRRVGGRQQDQPGLLCRAFPRWQVACVDGAAPKRSEIVARAWEIGGDTPTQLPNQSGQPVSVAIANDGTLVRGQAVDGPARRNRH